MGSWSFHLWTQAEERARAERERAERQRGQEAERLARQQQEADELAEALRLSLEVKW